MGGSGGELPLPSDDLASTALAEIDAAPEAATSEAPAAGDDHGPVTVAHLTTVASSLRYLLYPQLGAVRDSGGEVLGISAPGDDVEHLEANGIRHVALRSSTRSMNLLADLRSALELRRILRENDVDILHTHNPKPGLYGRIVGRLSGVPVVVNTNHGLYATEHSNPLSRLVVLLAEAVAARFSDAELIQNPEDLRLLTRWRLNSPRRTKLLGNGVNLDRFMPDKLGAADRTALRARWGAHKDTVVIGMVSRLVREKGCRELFEAARLLSEHGTDRFGVTDDTPDRYVFVVIGPTETDKADAITSEEIDRAQANGVVFLGPRDDVDELYCAMDIFALPSYREGFPRAAMEAAATGLPVVATDVRGCRQVVEAGETGLLVPLRNAEALARAIVELGEDPERRTTMGKAAAERAGRLFDEDEVVSRVLDAYREVAERKNHPALAGLLSPSS